MVAAANEGRYAVGIIRVGETTTTGADNPEGDPS
jgi:hypothetical protein